MYSLSSPSRRAAVSRTAAASARLEAMTRIAFTITSPPADCTTGGWCSSLALRHHLVRHVAHHEEAFANAHHSDRAVLEERIVVPRTRKARRILTRLRIEEA